MGKKTHTHTQNNHNMETHSILMAPFGRNIRNSHDWNSNKQQVLLVFPKNDVVCDIIQDACSRLEMDTFLSQTLPEAIQSFQNITNGGHNLIIVDGRLPQILDPETVAR